MAKDEVEETELDDQDEGKSKGNSNLKIIIVAVVGVVLFTGAMVGATVYFLKSDSEVNTATTDEDEEVEDEEVAEEDAEPAPPPMYHSLDPKFVVSFKDQRSARFMQFEIDVMTRDKSVVEKIDEHMSAVRSSLLMLFDGQNYNDMSTREGKQKLLMDVKEDINKTIVMMAGADEESVVEAAYFTSFVIQ